MGYNFPKEYWHMNAYIDANFTELKELRKVLAALIEKNHPDAKVYKSMTKAIEMIMDAKSRGQFPPSSIPFLTHIDRWLGTGRLPPTGSCQ